MRDYCPKISGMPSDLWRRTVNLVRGYDRIKDDLDFLIEMSPEMDGQPHGSGTSDPTGSIVVAREHLRRELDAIEDAKKMIPPELTDAVFLSFKDGRALYTFGLYEDPKRLTRERAKFIKRVAVNMGWWFHGYGGSDI